MEMQSERDFRLGFWFALLVARTMTYNSEPPALYDQLRSLVRGDLTLMASPAEVFNQIPARIREYEAKFGRPLTEHELKMLQQAAEISIPKNRAEQDSMNRDLASLILRLMDQAP